MALRGTWAAAKQTALALHALLRTKYPQDAIQVVGFSNYARELHETELAGLGWDMVQGTNLHHALMLAGRHLDKHPEHEPVVLIVTDGEPTAHLQRDGRPWFDWPPAPETIELTLAEVDKMTRRHAALNIFMLAEDDRLAAFVDNVAKRNGGRVLRAIPERSANMSYSDFLRTPRQQPAISGHAVFLSPSPPRTWRPVVPCGRRHTAAAAGPTADGTATSSGIPGGYRESCGRRQAVDWTGPRRSPGRVILAVRPRDHRDPGDHRGRSSTSPSLRTRCLASSGRSSSTGTTTRGHIRTGPCAGRSALAVGVVVLLGGDLRIRSGSGRKDRG